MYDDLQKNDPLKQFDWNNKKTMPKKKLYKEFIKLPEEHRIRVFGHLKEDRRVVLEKERKTYKEETEYKLDEITRAKVFEPFKKYVGDIYSIAPEGDAEFMMFMAILYSSYGITFLPDPYYEETRYEDQKRKIADKEKELMDLYAEVGLEAEAVIVNELALRDKAILTFDKQIRRYEDVWRWLLEDRDMGKTKIDRLIPRITKLFKESMVIQKRELHSDVSKVSRGQIPLHKSPIPKELQGLVEIGWISYHRRHLPNPYHLESEISDIFDSIKKIWHIEN